MTLLWPELPAEYEWDYNNTLANSMVTINIWRKGSAARLASRAFTYDDARAYSDVEHRLQELINECIDELYTKLEQEEKERNRFESDIEMAKNARAIIDSLKP